MLRFTWDLWWSRTTNWWCWWWESVAGIFRHAAGRPIVCTAPSPQGLVVPLSGDELRWGATSPAPSLNRRQLPFITALHCHYTVPSAPSQHPWCQSRTPDLMKSLLAAWRKFNCWLLWESQERLFYGLNAHAPFCCFSFAKISSTTQHECMFGSHVKEKEWAREGRGIRGLLRQKLL